MPGEAREQAREIVRSFRSSIQSQKNRIEDHEGEDEVHPFDMSYEDGYLEGLKDGLIIVQHKAGFKATGE